jgi:peptide/nickel transport system substrate-binding protein
MKRTLMMCSLAVLLFACGGGERDGDDTRPMVIVFGDSPTNLDSRIGNDQHSGRIFDLVYEGLVRFLPDGTHGPGLAESWDMPDDTTIVFNLRRGVTFHDGKPLTARDVKFTYDSLMADDFPGAKASGYVDVAALETPDDHTVIFRLTQANAGIFDNLTLGIVPEGSDPEVMKTRPIGAGPYRLIEYRVDERVRLEAFDDYFGNKANIRRIDIRVIPDATTRMLELRNGTVDFGLNVLPFDAVDQFRDLNQFQVQAEPGSQYQYLAFNLQNQYLRDPRVRQAIAHSIDRERIVRDLLLGYGEVTDTLFPPDHWAHGGNLTTYDYDPDRAKALLDEAGHRASGRDGERFRLSYRTSTDDEANLQAQMIQQMLRQVGIGVVIQRNEFGVFYEDIQKGNFDMFSLRWAGINDPDFYTYIFASRNVPPEGLNRGHYVNPRVDELIEQGRVVYDQGQRARIYEEIQEIVARELPYLSLYHRSNVAVMKEGLAGFEMYPAGFLLSLPEVRWR